MAVLGSAKPCEGDVFNVLRFTKTVAQWESIIRCPTRVCLGYTIVCFVSI